MNQERKKEKFRKIVNVHILNSYLLLIATCFKDKKSKKNSTKISFSAKKESNKTNQL